MCINLALSAETRGLCYYIGQYDILVIRARGDDDDDNNNTYNNGDNSGMYYTTQARDQHTSRSSRKGF